MLTYYYYLCNVKLPVASQRSRHYVSRNRLYKGAPMAGGLVTLEIEFAAEAQFADGEASLFWVNDADEEQHYRDFSRGDTVTQETFAGHQWAVRGKPSSELLLRVWARPGPPVQRHSLAYAGGGGPPSPNQPPPDVPADVAPPDGTGRWVGSGGVCRFERVADGDAGGVRWIEYDADANVAGTFEQLDARVETRWLWWAAAAWAQVANVSHEREYMAMCALSIAGAYNFFDMLALPPWLRRALAPATAPLGPNPLMALAVLLTLLGAVVAATVPLTESTLLLYNRRARTEVRLTTRRGFCREPPPAPGHASPWRVVCDGAFEVIPSEVRCRQGRQPHHGLFLAAAAALIGVFATRGGGVRSCTPVQIMILNNLNSEQD